MKYIVKNRISVEFRATPLTCITLKTKWRNLIIRTLNPVYHYEYRINYQKLNHTWWMPPTHRSFSIPDLAKPFSTFSSEKPCTGHRPSLNQVYSMMPWIVVRVCIIIISIGSQINNNISIFSRRTAVDYNKYTRFKLNLLRKQSKLLHKKCNRLEHVKYIFVYYLKYVKRECNINNNNHTVKNKID